MRRVWIALICVAVGVPTLYVAYEAVATLDVLTRVERERDTWQRPSEVLALLDIRAGHTVVDFGCGAGYFALKLAPMVGSTGNVFATDIRRESLAFLWIRATLGHHRQLRVVHGDPDDPRLPSGPVDAVLVANTYHELAAPAAVLQALARALKPGGRLVMLDRAPRTGAARHDGQSDTAHHEISPAVAEDALRAAGFAIVSRDDRFIDRPEDDDVWWVIAARRS